MHGAAVRTVSGGPLLPLTCHQQLSAFPRPAYPPAESCDAGQDGANNRYSKGFLQLSHDAWCCMCASHHLRACSPRLWMSAGRRVQRSNVLSSASPLPSPLSHFSPASPSAHQRISLQWCEKTLEVRYRGYPSIPREADQVKSTCTFLQSSRGRNRIVRLLSSAMAGQPASAAKVCSCCRPVPAPAIHRMLVRQRIRRHLPAPLHVKWVPCSVQNRRGPAAADGCRPLMHACHGV